MKRNLTLRQLTIQLEHIVYYNNLAPFPVFDTDYVQDIKTLINKMKEDNKTNYDDEPVVACKYCKSLHIRTDEDMNDICWHCGSTNDLKEFKNISLGTKF